MSLLFRIAASLAMIALVAVGAYAFIDAPTPITGPAASAPAAPSTFSALPPVDATAGRSILDRSPFIQGRYPFDRQAALAPLPAPVDVRLTGVLKMGKELRASLFIGGQSLMVKKGDNTPIGKVIDIEASAIVIAGSTTQRFEMLRQ